MAIDRGEFRYNVNVRDGYTAKLRDFRKQLDQTRRAIRDFRRDVERPVQASGLTGELQNTRRALEGIRQVRRQSADDTKRFTREEIAAQRQIAAEAQRQAAREREAARIRRALRADEAAQARSARQTVETERQRARSLRDTGRAARQTARDIDATTQAANRFLFTFRRLFGVLAAFTLAREAVSQFNNLVSSSIRFNAQLEISRLGIAGIIAATGRLRDSQGRLLSGAEAFAAAQQEARRQQELLRGDALRTTATFEELVNVLQVAVGPGLAQGLRLDQIRQLSVLISQAASAIGLAQNQLSEEIRALLTGNIRATSTRIAQVLSLTNEDIRSAREQGQLFELLQERLQGFDLAAREAANTVPGLLARIRDALGLVSGRAGLEFFEQIRDVLSDIFDLLTDETITQGGVTIITPNPEARRSFQEIFDALSDILATARQLGEGSGLDGFASTLSLIATTLRVVGNLLVAIGIGASRAFSIIQAFLSPILALIGGLSGAGDEIGLQFVEIVASISQFITLIVAARVALIALRATAVGLRVLFVDLPRVVAVFNAALRTGRGILLSMNVALRATRVTALSTQAVFLAIPIALATIIALVFQLSSELAGVNIKFETLAKIVGLSITAGLENVLTSFKVTFAAITKLLLDLTSSTIEATAAILVNISNFARLFSNDAAELLLDAVDKLDGVSGSIRRAAESAARDSQEAIAALGRQREEFGASLNDILSESGADRTFQQVLTDSLRGAGEEINSFFDDIFGTGEQKAEDFGNAFTEAFDVEGRGAEITRQQQDELRNAQQLADRTALQAVQAGRLVELERSFVSQQEIAVEQARQKLETLRLEQAQALQNLAIEVNRARQAAESAASDEERQLALQTLQGLEAQLLAVRQLQSAELKAQEIALERIEAAARGSLSVERQKLEELIRQRGAVIARLETERQALELELSKASSKRRQEEIELELADNARLRAAAEFSTAEAIEEQSLAIARLEGRARGLIEEGFTVGLRDFAQEFANAFEAGVRIARGIVDQFAAFVSDSIVDALDPNSDTDITERFGQFLQSIARLIIQELTKIAIAKAILGLGIGFSEGGQVPGFSDGGSVPGFADGGKIGSNGAKAGPAHYGLGGGPPRGVDPRDTQPIWAQPGEWVDPVHTVKRLGTEFFDRLRKGYGDPSALRALVGLGASRRLRVSSSRGPGFQEGGLVGDTLRSVEQQLQAQSAAQAEAGGAEATPAYLVADDRTLEKLLGGGKTAFRRFLRDNAADFDGILRGGRTGGGLS